MLPRVAPRHGVASVRRLCTDTSDVLDDIRRSVQRLCARYDGAYWQQQDKAQKYPEEFVGALGEAGFLSMLIPPEFGGGGSGLREACAVLEEIHRSGGNAGAVHAQMYTHKSVQDFATPAQKEKWLPQIASGTLRLQAFGVSEPNSGTDTLSLATTAKREGDVYRISGQKLWTSRAMHSDLMLLLARTASSDDVPRGKSLSLFLVDLKDAVKAGSVRIDAVETMMNHSTTQVFIDDLLVPAENLIGEEGQGLKVVLSSMNSERVLIAAECIGDGRFFVDRGSSYASERVVFGRPIGANQGVQFPLASAYSKIEAASLMVEKAADLLDNGVTGTTAGTHANMAKLLASEASWEAADTCVQTYGGFGFAREYDIERKFREARLYRVAPISSNLILSYIGEKVLGMPKSY